MPSKLAGLACKIGPKRSQTCPNMGEAHFGSILDTSGASILEARRGILEGIVWGWRKAQLRAEGLVANLAQQSAEQGSWRGLVQRRMRVGLWAVPAEACQQKIGGSCAMAPCCEGGTCSSTEYCEVCQQVIGGSCAIAPCCEGSTCNFNKFCVKDGR